MRGCLQAKPPPSAVVGPARLAAAKVPAITSTSSSSIRRRRERRDDPSGVLGDVSTPVFHRNAGAAPTAPPQEPLLLRQVSKVPVMLPRPATETRAQLSAAPIRGPRIDNKQEFHEVTSTHHKVPLKSALKRPVPPQVGMLIH